MSQVVIIGASRGIGLEFVRQYASEGHTVFATTRTPENPGILGTYEGDIRLYGLDVRFQEQRKIFARQLQEEPVDIFIYNAGVLPRNTSTDDELFEINVRAPIFLIELFLPMLERGQERKVVCVSGAYGSRQLTKENDWKHGIYAYSKRALNDSLRQMSAYWKSRGIIYIAVSPGSVKTDMNPIKGIMTPEQSVSGMRHVIHNLTPEDHNTFRNWRGEVLPW